MLAFIESGGYALRAYDKFKRLTRERGRQLAGRRIRASSSSTG